jgi:hypothetical protein
MLEFPNLWPVQREQCRATQDQSWSCANPMGGFVYRPRGDCDRIMRRKRAFLGVAPLGTWRIELKSR